MPRDPACPAAGGGAAAYPGAVEILLWLVPAAVVTTLAMLWAAWAGRETTRTVDPAEAAERLGRALRGDRPVRYTARQTPAYDGGSVAVRRASPPEPEQPVRPAAVQQPDHQPSPEPTHESGHESGRTRLAS